MELQVFYALWVVGAWEIATMTARVSSRQHERARWRARVHASTHCVAIARPLARAARPRKADVSAELLGELGRVRDDSAA